VLLPPVDARRDTDRAGELTHDFPKESSRNGADSGQSGVTSTNAIFIDIEPLWPEASVTVSVITHGEHTALE
jgi:hypothetical protein